MLEKVLRGVERATPSSSIRVQRPPITIDMLRILHSELDHTNSLDAAIMAAASLAFYSQLRLGELLPQVEDLKSFDPRLHPVVANIGAAHSAAGSRSLHLPWSKTKRSRGEDVVVARQQGRTDPVGALKHHIRTSKLSSSSPIASYTDSKGRLVGLTKRKFLRRCNEIWHRNGFQRFTGHSFRIGGTTYYLLAGVNPDVVKVFGRWASNTFLKYWRALDSLASMHIELMADKYRHM